MKLPLFLTTLLHFSCLNHADSKLFIFIGPSGVGKTTLTEKLQEFQIPLQQVITTTTRARRSAELEGKSYFFLSKAEFDQRKENNEFLATTTIYNNSYGVSKKYIQEKLQSNQNLICVLTADGAQELKNSLGHQVVTIFIAPPTLSELQRRLEQRKENQSALNTRLQNAAFEMQQQDSFDYKVINDDLERSARELIEIFFKETK